jgi:hypothetical protein
MRNSDHDRTRRVGRRGRTVLGIAGLASVLGAGAFLASGQQDRTQTAENSAATTRTAAHQSLAAADGIAGAPSAAAGRMGPVQPGAGASESPKSVTERLDDARGANERLGTTVRRPRAETVTNVDASKVRRVEKGTLKDDRRTMRIVSSRQDLTDYAELGWIGDEGVPYGSARCSRTIQISDKPAAEKPTLMICWRTTPKKSVYTIAVDLKKNPTAQDGAAALEKEWKRMG